MSCRKKKRLMIALIIIVLCIALIVGPVLLWEDEDGGMERAAGEEPGNELSYTGAHVCISALCPAEEVLWIVKPNYENGDFHNYLYKLDNDGQEEYIRKLPWLGTHTIWNEERERFYYTSEALICEYDPVTGAIETYALPEDYTELNYSQGDFVYLSDAASHDIMLSLETFEVTELPSMGSGRIVEIIDGYAFTRSSDSVGCYSTDEKKQLWSVDGVSVCASNGAAYFSLDDRGGVFTRPIEGDIKPVMTEIETRTCAVIDAGEYVICATRRYQSIEFVALYPDGTVENIATMEDVSWSEDGFSIMEIWNGQLYYARTSYDRLFVCDIP